MDIMRFTAKVMEYEYRQVHGMVDYEFGKQEMTDARSEAYDRYTGEQLGSRMDQSPANARAKPTARARALAIVDLPR